MSLTSTDFAQGVQTLASAWCDVVPADRGDWQEARALESVRMIFRTSLWALPMLTREYRMECTVFEFRGSYDRIHLQCLGMSKI